jgi:L1 cell adhesion molecule like protein
MQRGTFMQLQFAINRRNIKNEPKEDFSACEEFLLLVVTCHILCAAMKYLKMDVLDDVPTSEIIPENFWLFTDEQMSTLLEEITESLVTNLVDLSLPSDDQSMSTDDHVLEYAREVVSLGLLYMNYRDAIREGDGERILLLWKFMLLIFMVTSRRNYTVEAFHTLASYKLLPPRQSHQLMWSRFVNTHNKPGLNIPCDLFNEHLNRLCKDSIKHHGANKTEKAITHFSKCLGSTFKVLHNYDTEHDYKPSKSHHTKASSNKDHDIIIMELMEKGKVFDRVTARCYASFLKFKCNPIKKTDLNRIKQWLSKHSRSIGFPIS